MKEKLTTFLFLGVLFAFFLLHITLPDKTVTLAERRHLASFEPPSAKTVFDGSWVEDFETYVLDQFPGREGFRRLKADTIFHGFHLMDNHDLYVHNDHVIKMEYPLDVKSVQYFTDKIQNICQRYLTPDHNVYAAWIPDKNYYVHDPHLRIDYPELENDLVSALPDLNWIPLTDILSLDDYYLRDPHWKQEKLKTVAKRLTSAMHVPDTPFPQTSHVYENYYGAYHGQAAMPFSAEPLTYLTSPILDHCTVFNMQENRIQGIYNPEKLNGMDSYDVFLSGASPLLVIENPAVSNGRELLLFRDSFGSSLAPLLAGSYEKITLIDLRYLSSDLLNTYVEFSDQDVLFLYSTTLINKSYSLK